MRGKQHGGPSPNEGPGLVRGQSGHGWAAQQVQQAQQARSLAPLPVPFEHVPKAPLLPGRPGVVKTAMPPGHCAAAQAGKGGLRWRQRCCSSSGVGLHLRQKKGRSQTPLP